MDKLAEVIDIAAGALQLKFHDCKVRIAAKNKFRAECFLLLIPGWEVTKMCHIWCYSWLPLTTPKRKEQDPEEFTR
jgi:hypothetical protein